MYGASFLIFVAQLNSFCLALFQDLNHDFSSVLSRLGLGPFYGLCARFLSPVGRSRRPRTAASISFLHRLDSFLASVLSADLFFCCQDPSSPLFSCVSLTSGSSSALVRSAGSAALPD
jgi:hypothetical protein